MDVWAGTEWVSPDARVSVGDWEVQRYERVRLVSSASELRDRCMLVVDNTSGGAAPFAAGQEFVIEAGYRDTGYRDAFRGVVTDVRRRRTCTVQAADAGLLLERSRVKRCFVNMTAAEVVRALLEEAGIEEYSVEGAGRRRHHFVVPNLTIAEALRAVNRTWGLDCVTYAEPDGSVYWGAWEDSPRASGQQAQYVFERGVNIIDLRPTAQGAGELDTVWMPDLRHSQVLSIKDPEFVRSVLTVRAERVVHDLSSTMGRTTVNWRLAS